MNFSRETGFLIFRIILPVVLFTMQYVLYRLARTWLLESYPRARKARLFLALPFVVFNGALLMILILRPRMLDLPAWFRIAGVYPFFIWHGAMFFTGLIVGIVALIRAPFQLATLALRIIPSLRSWIDEVRAGRPYRRYDSSRRAFLKTGLTGVVGVSVAGATYGTFVERHAFEVTAAEFPVQGLPPSLENFTIALVSDVHSSVFMTRSEMEEYAEVLNGLNADMIVVPGDFVNSMTEEVYPFAEAFSTLKAPCGVFGVMGNHDYFAGEPETVAREVNACGIRMLRNASAVVEKGTGRLCIAGIDDVGRRDRALQRMHTALDGIPPQIPRVLLCHRPYFLDEAAEADIDLVLSGHTHGGQIVLGRIGNLVIAPASFASQYIAGKYSAGKTQMYVSRGIGTVGLPIRINCPPEVTKITLMKGAEA